MPTAAPQLPPIPRSDVVAVDPRTGRVTKDWYDYLKALDNILRIVRSEIP